MSQAHERLPLYRRGAFARGDLASQVGDGELGGKARGLLRASRILSGLDTSLSQHQLAVSIPQMVVLSTELFDEFMERNGLYELAFDELEDERIAAAFQDADFPMEFVGDLRGLVEDVREPLAVRSSSLLEDRMVGPFAGVYGTKMVPNDQPDSASRFAKLIEAIKFIYASVFFREPRDYFRALGEDPRREKMAVLLQRIVGQRHGERFYPHVSGVARSFNYYPFGEAKRRDGVVHLALGLGKWVVDGESTWMFSPEQPRSGPPFNGPDDMMKRSQLEFWAVRMGKRADFDPLSEDEYLERYSLFEADYDATLDQIASTFDADLGRLIPGVSRKGARVLDFAPILQHERVPLVPVLRELLEACKGDYGADVEIEFALVLGYGGSSRFELLQVRASPAVSEAAAISEEEFEGDDIVIRARNVLGNGVSEEIQDVVYVDRALFEERGSAQVASDVARLNRRLRESATPYMLVGFGRWGSVDRFLGIPVDWSMISGARSIVELPLPHMVVDPSQGSHFFHNVVSFGLSYFHLLPQYDGRLDWEWLESFEARDREGACVHVRLPSPLQIKVDGESGLGLVRPLLR
jgi:hypothetical protein